MKPPKTTDTIKSETTKLIEPIKKDTFTDKNDMNPSNWVISAVDEATCNFKNSVTQKEFVGTIEEFNNKLRS